MCFPRKSCLGHYNANRLEWKEAYRAARILLKNGGEPNYSVSGVYWKAQLIISCERDQVDVLSMGAQSRLNCMRLTNEILAELDSKN